jgi:hypothetical protein
MDNSPSFAERISEFENAAFRLRDTAAAIEKVAEIVLTEAQHMEAAQSRFAARQSARQTQRASR